MAGAFASAMLVAGTACAQDSRLSLAERVSRLEQQAQAQDKGGIGMVNQVQQLQSQVQQLQGQIEELQHQLQQLDEKNKAQYIDLDSRITRLQGDGGARTPPAAAASSPDAAPAGSGSAAAGTPAGNTAPAQAASAPAAATTPASADEQGAYDAAFQALRGGDYANASRGFRDFIQQHPDSALAPNAWYWLGESYYVTTNYAIALEAFQRLLANFPQSDKAPDALLKVGYTQYELKQADQAQATLRDVIARYPGTKAASLAQERLNRIALQSAN